MKFRVLIILILFLFVLLVISLTDSEKKHNSEFGSFNIFQSTTDEARVLKIQKYNKTIVILADQNSDQIDIEITNQKENFQFFYN